MLSKRVRWRAPADAIDAGNIQVNVHTLFSLPGEIRGQLSQVGDLPWRK